MRVGIVTTHHVVNYGAMLQVWGLCQMIRQLGLTPEVIDYRPACVERKYRRLLISPRSPIARPRQVWKFRRFMTSQLPLSPECFNRSGDLRTYSERYEAIVSGSDEIWNVAGAWSSHQLEGFDGAYFLEFASPAATRLVSYAASIGETLSFGDHTSKVERLLARYDAISVRELSAQRYLSEGFGIQAEVVLDPGLVADYDAFDTGRPVPEDYALVFSDAAAPVAGQINGEIAKRGMPAFSVGYHSRTLAQDIIAIGPQEFIPWIKHATIVLTTMFHGVVFALRFGREFVYFPRPNKIAKVQNLLRLAGIQDHLEQSPTQCFRMSDQARQAAAERIERLRQSSVKFLSNALAESAPA